ncbi:hypothetical protein [Riemerella anatipestifer]|uniref:DUF3592 domain-containing protein n=1 Tax=Riemerella anatipestifer TaxID=34085 RepID=A0A1S7DTT4_RIEAN|nr:hypothetical protein [Riemerella anatipestifer]AQY22471.1 hypothetical protein AB406_1526 [Riemerella anatipestifer]MBO4234258.1 hypothetical protein [Riemerella anatipestifer]MBT0549952.1 hypothetical protein [Riemerella anatipestifer]MBT0556774.1 hypothetical protein [Riemerella anatipestifer]MBT0560742.1 hypothetical protein [Riemerella anatipestifer]
MTEIKNRKENIKLILIAFISSLILLFFATKWYFYELPDQNSIVEINDVFKEKIKTERGYKGKISLVIKLRRNPNINFKINSISWRTTDSRELIEENKIGDSITLYVKKSDYKSKILNPETNDSYVDVVEIRNNKTVYLSLSDYNRVHSVNNILGILFFSFFGVFMFILGLMGIRYHRKNFK